MVDSVWETVYTVTNYHDGPIEGIANHCGQPHVYQAEFDEVEDDYVGYYQISPVDPDVFRLALESRDIWLRWKNAFKNGLVSRETHPALPEERARYDEIATILRDHLVIHPADATRTRAKFKRLSGSGVDGTWQVQWLED